MDGPREQEEQEQAAQLHSGERKAQSDGLPQLDLLRAEIEQLASLEELEYAAVRRDAAKRLRLKVGFLDLEVEKVKRRRAKERQDEFVAKNGGPPQGCKEAGAYFQTPEGMFLHDLYGERRLTNFAAEIVADVVVDDGAETARYTGVIAEMAGREFSFEISAKEFGLMQWVAIHIGPKAIIHPGKYAIEHTATAIKLFSPNVQEKRRYAHTGWRMVNDKLVYLHAGGAIAAEGAIDNIEVLLPAPLTPLRLSSLPESKELEAAVRATLRLQDLAASRIMAPLQGAAFRAVLREPDFSLFISGETGIFKTETAALIQQHFAPECHAKNLPTSFRSTANNNEALGFACKDAILVIDEFKPAGTIADRQRMQREAEILLRAHGNRSGRGRMRADTKLRPPKPPRGIVIATGEESLRGQSLLARVPTIEVKGGDIDAEKLSVCQADAAARLYAQSMSGFIQWLATGTGTGDDKKKKSRLVQLKQELASRLVQSRAGSTKLHRRIGDTYAQLGWAWDTFLQFAQEAGAISESQASDYRQRICSGLEEFRDGQAKYQTSEDPVLRFLQLLGAAISSGAAHVADRDGGVPCNPSAWGWRQKTIGTGDHVGSEWQPQGVRVGWVEENDLYLAPDAAYKAAHDMGRGADGLDVGELTLRKSLFERQMMLSSDGTHLTSRRDIEGRRSVRVFHLHADLLIGGADEDAPF